jgi:hypothetical protein
MGNRRLLRLAFGTVLLFAFVLSGRLCYAQGTEIPYVPDGWTIDGDLSDDESESAVQLLDGAYPLGAWAMHDGESLYLALETLSPTSEGAPEEIFVVFENGDGALYSEGDHLIRCFAEGCEHWRYVAEFQFEFVSDLPSAASPNVVETTIFLDRGWSVFGPSPELEIGLIYDGEEMGPWPVPYELEPIPESVPEPPLDTPSPESPVLVAGETEEPEPTAAPVEEVPDSTVTSSTRYPGWLLPGIAGGTLLALLLGWLFGFRRRKPKKLTPCEAYAESMENLPPGWLRAASVEVENGRDPSYDPKKARADQLGEGIEDLKKMPPSEERDKAIEGLESEIRNLKYSMSDSSEVQESAGANMSVDIKGVPDDVPKTIEWFVDTKEKGYSGEKIGEGKSAELSPEQLDDYASRSPATGVVRVKVKITICPGTPQERTFWSNLMQVTQVPELIWKYT